MSRSRSPASPSQRLTDLELAQLELAPEPNGSGLCSPAPFAGPGFDQMPFESGEASEDGDHQLAVRRGGVAPRISRAT
jgi:hypothetical protein